MTSLDISYDEAANHTFSMDNSRLTDQVPAHLSTLQPPTKSKKIVPKKKPLQI